MILHFDLICSFSLLYSIPAWAYFFISPPLWYSWQDCDVSCLCAQGLLQEWRFGVPGCLLTWVYHMLPDSFPEGLQQCKWPPAVSERPHCPHTHMNWGIEKWMIPVRWVWCGTSWFQPALVWVLVKLNSPLYTIICSLFCSFISFASFFKWVPNFYCSFSRHSLNVLVIHSFSSVAMADISSWPAAAC